MDLKIVTSNPQSKIVIVRLGTDAPVFGLKLNHCNNALTDRLVDLIKSDQWQVSSNHPLYLHLRVDIIISKD